MPIFIITFIGIGLFYLDTLINTLMPVQLMNHSFYFTSHLLFIYLLIIAVYKNPTIALILALFFGLISDVYFSTLYGVYLFGYVMFIVLMNQLFKVFYKDVVVMIGLLVSFVVLLELYFFIIYSTLNNVHMGIWTFIWSHAIPTSFLNFVLIITIFPFVLKLLETTDKVH